MPTHTPNMVNMRMETRSVNSSQSQDTPAALTSELGADAELVQHTQQLGELPCPACQGALLTTYI